MKQLSLSESRFLPKHARGAPKVELVAEINAAERWSRLEGLIEPVYRPPSNTAAGGLADTHSFQQWSCYLYPAMNGTLYEMLLLPQVAGLDAREDLNPDETTILEFCHLQEANTVLSEEAVSPRCGMAVDAGLIAVPSYTKNSDCKRDTKVSLAKVGNQWFIRTGVHLAAYAESGAAIGTAANAVTLAKAERHGEEKEALGYAAYHGAEERCGAMGNGRWNITMRQGKRLLVDKPQKSITLLEQPASICAKVEHPFRVIKRHFGFTKVRYSGLFKNIAAPMLLGALSDLWMARQRILLSMAPEVRQ